MKLVLSIFLVACLFILKAEGLKCYACAGYFPSEPEDSLLNNPNCEGSSFDPSKVLSFESTELLRFGVNGLPDPACTKVSVTTEGGKSYQLRALSIESSIPRSARAFQVMAQQLRPLQDAKDPQFNKHPLRRTRATVDLLNVTNPSTQKDTGITRNVSDVFNEQGEKGPQHDGNGRSVPLANDGLTSFNLDICFTDLCNGTP